MTFVKGQSGNPRGRPGRRQELAPCIRRLLREVDPATGRPNRETVARALIVKAKAGDVEAIKVVLDRVDGKLATPIEGGDPARPLVFRLLLGESDADG